MEYLSSLQIEELVKELIWSYRQLFLPGVESAETTPADYNRYSRESEQAWSALKAAFGHREEFKKEMLQDMSEGAIERLQNLLVGWTHDMEWPNGGTAGSWVSTASDAEECGEKTRIFMEDRYWPFTKIIRCGLLSPTSPFNLLTEHPASGYTSTLRCSRLAWC